MISISKKAAGSWTRQDQTSNDDDAAIAKAKVIAIGVSLDKPAVDPEPHIAVLNESREEIFKTPVYSKPSITGRRDGDHSVRLFGRTITVTGTTNPLASSSANSLISILWRISSLDVASSASASSLRQSARL
jgi:hypothetical protein